MTEQYIDLITGKPLEPWAQEAMDRRATPSQRLDAATVEREGDLAYERQYFERGFIAAYAWAATKRADVQLSDDVIDHAWAHRDEGMDADDMLPVRALATEPYQHGGKA